MGSVQQTPHPPAPPPPPPPRKHETAVSESRPLQPFTTKGTTKDDIVFEFPKSSNAQSSVPLRTVVEHYLSGPNQRIVSAHQLFMILGRLRCLRHTITKYNDGTSTRSPVFLRYWRPRALNTLSGFGSRISNDAPITITGLDEIIRAVEDLYDVEIGEARRLTRYGSITFDALGELYQPDTPIQARTALGGALAVFIVADCYYEERCAIGGKDRIFHLTLEFVAAMGDHFIVVSFSEVFSGWTGAHARPLASLPYVPLSTEERPALEQRGENYARCGTGGAQFLAYAPYTFFLRSPPSSTGPNTSWLARPKSNQLAAGGRMMVDTSRGSSLGYHASTGLDESALSLTKALDRYRQWRNLDRTGGTPPDSLNLWDTVPSEMHLYCWPALAGFSFTDKAWGQILVSGLEPIKFRDQAFENLVLSEERKQLIRALVRFGTDPGFDDIVSGKRGGSIFLLHGPPGVGKTLTAEAIAEVLQRPLYSVTMGELGTNADDLERRVGDVLELCAEWNALTILDEADVFLEERNSLNVTRNSMVCVMLRLLEYHPGILFLTTNRVRSFDPAIESRVTIAMRYEPLEQDARIQIWELLLGLTSMPTDDVDYQALGSYVLNGRQIKNAVRLGIALAKERGLSTLDQATLNDTLKVTSLGKSDMN